MSAARGYADEVAGVMSSIKGWTTLDEGRALYRGVLDAARRTKSVQVVEIGSFEGRSTSALALAVRSAGEGRVYAIDPHGPELDHFEQFLQNMRRIGVSDIVEPMRMPSREARWSFENRSVDVLFVDGSHEYDVVSHDIWDWTSALAPEAIVAFNDPFWPGVQRALLERVVVPGSPFRSPRLVSNSLFYRYQPERRWTGRDSVDFVRLRALLAIGRPLRGPHRKPEAYRRAPLWWRRAEGLFIDGLLDVIGPGASVETMELSPDASFIVSALIQSAVRQRLSRTAILTTEDFHLTVQTGAKRSEAEASAARALLLEVAGSVFGGPYDEESWFGALRGGLVEASFVGRRGKTEHRAGIEAELHGERVARMAIRVDPPGDAEELPTNAASGRLS